MRRAQQEPELLEQRAWLVQQTGHRLQELERVPVPRASLALLELALRERRASPVQQTGRHSLALVLVPEQVRLLLREPMLLEPRGQQAWPVQQTGLPSQVGQEPVLVRRAWRVWLAPQTDQREALEQALARLVWLAQQTDRRRVQVSGLE